VCHLFDYYSHLSFKNYSLQLRVSWHFSNISYSLMRYIGDISFCTSLLMSLSFQIPNRNNADHFSHSSCNGLYTFLSPTLVSKIHSGTRDFLLFIGSLLNYLWIFLYLVLIIWHTGGPPYPRIQYPRFQLSTVGRGLKKNFGKLEK
jgi:hypothetical protein